MSVKKLTSCPLCRLLMSSRYATSPARMPTIVNDYDIMNKIKEKSHFQQKKNHKGKQFIKKNVDDCI